MWNNKIVVYTCSSGLGLMKGKSEFYAWKTRDSNSDIAIEVSRKFLGTTGGHFFIGNNSDAKIIEEIDNDFFYGDGGHSEHNSLKISSNYEKRGVTSWKKAKEVYGKSNDGAFYVEVSRQKGIDEEEMCPCDCNYTSLTITEAERLVEFLQNKIAYLKGE